jgi:zinc transport system permease protein
MSGIIEQLTMYFTLFPFVRYAFIVSILIAFCSALLGVTLVLKRFSFIGTGLSNVAFFATAAGVALGFNNNIILVLPVTVACAILLLCSGRNAKIKGDAALAMVSVGALAVGYLLMNIFPPSSNVTGDVCNSLFGSTALVTLGERAWMVWLCIGLSVFVTVIFLLFYHKIFAVTFDEDFAAATGIRAKLYNLLLAVVVAVVIVMAMNLVGALLASALVIFPALTAMRLFKSFRGVIICSVAVSVTCTALGILLSMLEQIDTPIGSTIVTVNIVVFGIFSLIGAILRR